MQQIHMQLFPLLDWTTTAIGSDTAVTTTSTDSVLRLDSTGAKAFYDANNYSHFHSTGLDVYGGGIKTAIFGATTAIGSDTAVTTTSTDSVLRLDSTGAKAYYDGWNGFICGRK